MNRRTRTAVLGTAFLLTAAVAGSAAASASDDHRREAVVSDDHGRGAAVSASHDHRREAAALTGTAKLSRSTAEDITFSFDAHLAAKDVDNPLKATGTFEWSHYLHGDGACGHQHDLGCGGGCGWLSHRPDRVAEPDGAAADAHAKAVTAAVERGSRCVRVLVRAGVRCGELA